MEIAEINNFIFDRRTRRVIEILGEEPISFTPLSKKLESQGQAFICERSLYYIIEKLKSFAMVGWFPNKKKVSNKYGFKQIYHKSFTKSANCMLTLTFRSFKAYMFFLDILKKYNIKLSDKNQEFLDQEIPTFLSAVEVQAVEIMNNLEPRLSPEDKQALETFKLHFPCKVTYLKEKFFSFWLSNKYMRRAFYCFQIRREHQRFLKKWYSFFDELESYSLNI